MKNILKEEESGWISKPFFDEIKQNMPSVEELIKMAKERASKQSKTKGDDTTDSDEKDDLINKY